MHVLYVTASLPYSAGETYIVGEVLERARTINTFLKNHSMGDTVATDWNTIKIDLVRIATAYKLKTDM